jgi:predicted ABC-type ATPase
MPKIIIVAGPNGAGKTTFAAEYLRAQKHIEFVNADELARGLAVEGLSKSLLDIRAGRMMLERIEELARCGTDFAFETTLATLTYAQKIPSWQHAGYVVALVYLRLPTVEVSIDRVRKRVEAGGHGIPEEIIRRRFDKSSFALEKVYKALVNEWYVWDSEEGNFITKERWDQT